MLFRHPIKRSWPYLAISFLLGVVLGFLLSPAKNGIGNTVNHYEAELREEQ